jgi:hypothetical protein
MEMALFAAHMNSPSISRVGATHSPDQSDACVWGQGFDWRSAGGSDHKVAAAAGSSIW